MIDRTWYIKPKNIKKRKSAGGIVVRFEKSHIMVALALIDDEFVLPKGGIKEGESPTEAAIREIKEEAGITDLSKIMKLEKLSRLNYTKEKWIRTQRCAYSSERDPQGWSTTRWYSSDLQSRVLVC